MGRRRKGRPVHGWLVLDKPAGLGSTQALARTRGIFQAAKAGHGGTLDPLASGLLPIAFGEATKTVPYAMDGQKIYRFTIRWGEERSTDDAEGEVTATSGHRPSRADVEAALGRFTGTIEQVPPAFSAIRVNGERAYDLARAGAAPELAPRPVRIDSLTVAGWPDADHCVLEAACGKGTYVRALARDLGRALGTCAHISTLRRTRVGPFHEEDMISLEQLQEMRHSGAVFEDFMQILKPVATALDDIPALAVSRDEAARLRNGQPILVRGMNTPPMTGTVYAHSGGVPVAIAAMERGELHPVRVFNLPV
ncbi:MAG TPA: tRNA pseudouridine(55) synthase TruB [Rhodobacteraceae bacterium]|nr:tRNA pseudouridine(55) synthase TruB [Paracoccaceae bacterium]